MTRFDAGTLGGKPVVFYKTIHGSVVGYATVKGRKVAISRRRSSYGRDVLDLLAYRDASSGRIRSPKGFFKAFAQSPQTFNSFYIDSRHIAEFTSGLLPKRPTHVDPGLLTDGRGGFEWRGYEPVKAHPQDVDPPNGYIVNWNNTVARGFGASDEQWMQGSAQRVDLLNHNLGRLSESGKQTLATVTSAMNAAATQDVRAIDTVPLLADLLAGSTAPSARAQQMLDLLVAWRQAGGSRLDRNGDGKIDDPGAAIMDAAWPKVADAFMSPVLGSMTSDLASVVKPFDAPPSGQFGGWYQYFDKDVRTLLGRHVRGKYANRYCGGGDKARCQADLWAAIDAAGGELAQAQGPDPAAWRADATAERITFVPGLLPTTMRYTNRPTGIQQVISFKGHR